VSGLGAPHVTVQAVGVRVAIVAASWHQEVMAGLVAGAQRACAQSGAQAELVRVPGSFELPVMAQAVAPQVDAVVALGVVIRGSTPHFDYVCQAATSGLVRVSLDHSLPIGFGLLTCDDEQQALDRAGLPGSREDKGAEATLAALATLQAMREFPPRP